MERTMTIFGMQLLLVAACFVGVSCEGNGPPPSDQMISIGTHRLQIRTEGKGTPTVVIEAGITDLMENWRPLQQRIAKETRIITYNRAGYGQSEPGPLPRHSGREAEELKALLDAASVPGPYVVVGHSLGGLNAQVFAAKYPQDVAGIVLLDPPPLSFIRGEDYTNLLVMADQMTAEWQAVADADAESADAEQKARGGFFKMIASEHREMFGESARLVSEISSFGDTPLLVMAAKKPNPAFEDLAEEYQQYWIEQSSRLSRKSSKGKFILAEESTHHLYKDVPELVVESILSVVNQVRGEK
jgi:pimeloyl-ACP methyl ester carboxylesterase